jgi:O-6-methylguanine DNA methyltransferase
MLEIPRGQVWTYGELARHIGHPRAARAVGQACRANPLPLFIPCHRVTGANNTLGGFSCGPAWKVLLLKLEQINQTKYR